MKALLKMFYFILKALYILKIFKFLSWLFGHVEKMAWLFVNQPGLQIIATDILPSISRSKGSQTRKFDQVIDKKRYIFLKNHAENEAGRLVPDLYLLFKKVLWGKRSGLQLFR